MTPRANVLIPAWIEGNVIRGLLTRLAQATTEGHLRVIVIANACTDDTAETARKANPAALVLETPESGKANAMNLGYKSAVPGIPIVCVDADLIVTADDILGLITPLTNGSAHASCGQMVPDVGGSSWAVRAFYDAWALNPYFAKGKFGGMFALSAQGAGRVFPLPRVTADDEWVRRAFAPAERAYVASSRFFARAPKDLGTLIRLRRRSLRGARAVRAVVGQTAAENSVAIMLSQALRRPSLWPGMILYILVMGIVRWHLKRESPAAQTAWERDTGNRTSEACLK